MGALGAAARFVGVGLDAAGAISKFKDSLGILEDEVVVRIAGSPAASRQTQYYLAASIGFSLAKRIGATLLPPPGSIGIEYDSTQNEIVFSLRYSQSLASAVLIPNSGIGADGLSNIPVYQGPDGDGLVGLVGAPWAFKNLLVPGFPGPVPTLPAANTTVFARPINGICPAPGIAPAALAPTVAVPDVRPQGDCRSRGTLVWLVTQALTTPASTSDSTYLLPTTFNKFSGG